jgi:hypothetical protein
MVNHTQLPSIVPSPVPRVASTSQLSLTTLPAIQQYRFLVKPTSSFTNLSTAVIEILSGMGVSIDGLKASVTRRLFSEMIGTPAVTAALKSNAMFNVEGRILNNETDFLSNAVPLSILGMAVIVSEITNTADDLSKQVCEIWFNAMESIPDAVNYPDEVNAEIKAYTDKIPELLKQVLFLHYINRNVQKTVMIGLQNITKMIVRAVKARLDAIKARADLEYGGNCMTTNIEDLGMD